MSIQALPRDVDDLASDAGADIPDIPLRRRPQNGRNSPELGPPSAVAGLDDILTGSRGIPAHQLYQPQQGGGPVNPNGLQYSTEQKNGLGRAKSPEPDDNLRVQTRSPSTYQRSVFSMQSKGGNSIAESYQTNATSLAALQTKATDDDGTLEPLLEEEIEPGSFDLVAPAVREAGLYTLERRSELLFSAAHLQKIFDDAILLQRFTTFLCNSRPASVPLLVYYLDALKALKAISYSNAIVEALDPLEGHDFTKAEAVATVNEALTKRAETAFEALARDDLPAYITNVWIQTVSVSIKKRISGTLPPNLREMSEGLAEVFCLTDPSRHDNPIVFASEEFHRTTQYGMGYVLGRNCRFLQGPKTNPFSVKRIRESLEAGKEHYETFLNYRRDGSPFMNLLMVAPLYDSRGVVRYFIGAQVDVSGLAKDCVGLESLRRLVDEDEGCAGDADTAGNTDDDDTNKNGADDDTANGHGGEVKEIPSKKKKHKNDEIRELSEMFNLQELETVRRYGGSMHRLQHFDEVAAAATTTTSSSNHHHHSHHQAQPEPTQNWHRQRVLIRDEASSINSDLSGGDDFADPNPPFHPHSSQAFAQPSAPGPSGRLTGVYENYLLVRPHPSLRILFASPSLRVPGILQSHFLSKIGGSSRVRDELTRALAEGTGVTARVRWVSRTSGEGRHRWIHCTPLLGGNGAIGVWMVVITDDDDGGAVAGGGSRRPARDAPPVEMPGRLSALGYHGNNNNNSNNQQRWSHQLAKKPAVTNAGDLPAGLAASATAAAATSAAAAAAVQEKERGRGGMLPPSPLPGSPAVQARDFGQGTRSSSPYTLRIGEE